MQAHIIYPNDVSPEDYSRPVSPLGSSSTDTELMSAAASVQPAGRGSRSVPNTPSRANLTASFNAVQQLDEGPIVNTPAGSPKRGRARPMLPEDSTDQAGVSPSPTQGAPQQADSPLQGPSSVRASVSLGGPKAGPSKVSDSSSSSSSSRDSGALQGPGASPAKGRHSRSKGSSMKGRGSPTDVHDSPARAKGSNSKDSSSHSSSNKGSISRDDDSKGNSGTALKDTALTYKDKLLSEDAPAAASSSAAYNRHSPASSVSSAQSWAGQDLNGRSSRQGSKATGQNSKSKAGGSNCASAEDITPQDGLTALQGVTPRHEAAPQHEGGCHHGAELANASMSHQAASSPQSSLPHRSRKVPPTPTECTL